MNFKNYYTLKEDMKSYRQRLKAIQQNQLSDHGIDIVNKEEARIKMKKAYNSAHLKNKQSLQTTKQYPTIYHMIRISRLNIPKNDVDTVKNTIGITLNYLLFPEDEGYENDELSVSVDKQIWDYKDAIILEGTGKLEYYFDVDIYSKPVEIKPGQNVKIPRALYRKEGDKHWDEAFVKLKNIKWNKIILGEFENYHKYGQWIEELLKESDLVSEYENKINDDLVIKYYHQETSGGIQELRQYEEDKEEKIKEIDHWFGNIQDLYNKVNRKYTELPEKPEEVSNFLNELYKKIPDDFATYIPDEIEQSQDQYLDDLDQSINELIDIYDQLKQLNKMITNQKLVAEKYNPAWQLSEVEIKKEFENLGKYDEEGQKLNNNIRDLRRKGKGGWSRIKIRIINNVKYELFQKGKQFDVFASDYRTNNTYTYGLTESIIRPFVKDVKNYPQVYLTYVYDLYQGKKIGYNMHDLLIDHCGGIISDMTLTPGSYHLLKKLGEKYNISILDENDNLVPFTDDEYATGNYNRVLVVSKEKLI